VPNHVLVQTHHAVAVAREQADLPAIARIIVPALIVRRGFVCYEFLVNDELVDAVRTVGRDFWRQYVQTGEAPPESMPSSDTIKRMLRVPDKIVPVDGALVAAWLDAKRQAAEANAVEETARDAMLASIGDAEAGECEMGRVEYMQQARAGYTVQPSMYRVLRFKKPKALTGRNFKE
jgi:hypothetical protein